MDPDLISTILSLAIPLCLLVLGLLIGSSIERRHFRELDRREQEFAYLLQSDLKTIPPNWNVTGAVLVDGSAVIASDYFKSFAASLRNLFGGRVRSLETLMERARREAVLRMLEEARAHQAQAVWNIRLETSMIQGQGKNVVSGVEIIAYGTALRIEP